VWKADAHLTTLNRPWLLKDRLTATTMQLDEGKIGPRFLS
jgi:hypothetical protein